MSEIKEMSAFVAVAKFGSFVAAGKKLGISTVMVSRRVAELEAGLGVRLLQRTTRSVVLTASGKAYAERCEDILQQLEEANAAIISQHREIRGKLRINAPLTFGNLHLAQLWGAYMQAYPEVELEVDLSDRFIDTVEEGYDLTIRIGQLQPSSLVMRQLTESSLVFVASPSYLASAPALTSPLDLYQHRIIDYTGAAQARSWVLTEEGGETQQIDVSKIPGLRTNSGDTCVRAAIAGYGITAQPHFLVYQALEEGKLIRLLTNCMALKIGIYVLYPSRKHLNSKVRSMVDFLVAQFQKPRW